MDRQDTIPPLATGVAALAALVTDGEQALALRLWYTSKATRNGQTGNRRNSWQAWRTAHGGQRLGCRR